MNIPLISIILPVYNGAETLSCALSSVLEQTFKNYEVLLLDDGSTDNSLQVASTFSDTRLCIFSDGINRGLAYRLNQGIDLANGSYIARMDQDDICFPERLARQFMFLEIHPEVDLLGCRALVFRSQLDIIGLIPFRGSHEEICAYPWRGLYLAHPCWMGRTEWFRRHRYRIPEAIHADDQELLLRAYPESRFACLEEVLLAYRKEHFRLSKIWRARLALLKVQLLHFASRRQWSNALLSVVSAFIKVVADVAVVVVGDKRLIFGQIAEPVPTALLEKFRKLGCESRL